MKTTNMEEMMVCSTFDVDEATTCTTLQQPKDSIIPKKSLFHIKVKVKDWKVNYFFNSGSQCNLTFDSLVDKLGLETHNLVQPCSLGEIKINMP
jgi:hypothetical protein